MKKKFILVLAIVVIVSIACVCLLVGCNDNKDTSSKSTLKASDIYAFSAVTGGSFISSNAGSGEAAAGATAISREEVENLNTYVDMFDGYLSSGSFSTTVETSDRAEYATKIIIKAKGLDGTEITKILYYNETSTISEEVLDEEEAETYTSTKIKGILVDNDVEYFVEGSKEIETETEDSETETEISTNMKMYLDETKKDIDYVTIFYSVEEETGEKETYFTYSKSVGGKIIESSKVKIDSEIEDGESEEEIVIQSLIGGVSNLYSLKRKSEADKEKLEIRYTEGETIKCIEVEKVNGKNQYILDDGNTITIED